MPKVNNITNLTLAELFEMHPRNCMERGDYYEKEGHICQNYCWGLALTWEMGEDIGAWKNEHCKDCECLVSGGKDVISSNLLEQSRLTSQK